MLDRFINGDPTNDDVNGTAWEQDPYGTQLRFGGDVQGLSDTLDYITSMGYQRDLSCWITHDQFSMG